MIRIYYRKDQEVDEEYTLKTCRIDVKPFECTSHDGESRTRWARSSGFFSRINIPVVRGKKKKKRKGEKGKKRKKKKEKRKKKR